MRARRAQVGALVIVPILCSWHHGCLVGQSTRSLFSVSLSHSPNRCPSIVLLPKHNKMVANLLSPTCSKKGNLDFHTRSLQRSISEKALKDFDNLTYKTCQRHPAIPQSVTLRKLPTLNQPGIDRRTHIETGGPDLSDLRGVCCPNFLMYASLSDSP